MAMAAGVRRTGLARFAAALAKASICFAFSLAAGQNSAPCAPEGQQPVQCQGPELDSGRESEASGPWLSLLQHQAAVVDKMQHGRSALSEIRKIAVPTLDGECADLDDVKEQIGALNDTADAAADVATVVNASTVDMLDGVNSSLNAALTVLKGIKAATKAVAVFNGGAATLELVDSFVDMLAPSLTKVQTDLQEIVDTANEKVAGILEKLTGVRDDALGEFATAVDQVTALCDVEEILSLAEAKKKDAPVGGLAGWFRNLFRGGEDSSRGDDFDKTEAAIAKANDTAATMADVIDDLNTTAMGALTGVLDGANSSLTAIKEEALPKALAAFDGKMPKPIMAIVSKQANAAVDKAFNALDFLEAAVPNATAAVLVPIEEAREHLSAVFAASDGLVAITEDARAKAELGAEAAAAAKATVAA